MRWLFRRTAGVLLPRADSIWVRRAGDTRVHLWELATGQERGLLSGNHHLVTCLAFAADGKVLALGSSDASVRVWDPLAGKELRRFDGIGGWSIRWHSPATAIGWHRAAWTRPW